MAIRWHDVSIPMKPGMTVWPGDPPFELAPLTRIAEGASCNTSLVTFPTHAGTHVDAPWHFVESGKRLDEIDTAIFFGEALLIDLPDVDRIHAVDLGPDPLPPRVLFKTRNSNCPPNGPFRRDFVAVASDAAERLVNDGVRLVGVDYLSVAPFNEPGSPTHHVLLSREVFVIEGLCLQGFPAGTYLFTALPMPLVGVDGAPCRAFIGQKESDA